MATTWRLLIHATATAGNTPSIAEIVFATTVGGASAAAGGTPASSSDYPGYPAANAFDGNSATFWNCNGVAPSDQWIQYTFPSGVTIAEVRITSRPDGYGTTQSPASFDLQVASDGVTFTTVKSYTAPTWTAGQTQAFVVPAPASAAAPGNAMVSQSRLEVLGKGLPKVTVAQSQLEVLGKTNPAALVLQSFVEVLFRPSSSTPGPRPRRVFVAMT